MNRYLEKIAQISDENKQVAKTFAYQSLASIPAHAAGAAAGGYLGHKVLEPRAASIEAKLGRFGSKLKLGAPGNAKALGAAVGMGVAGGLADLAALKHSLHGKVKQK